MPEQTPSRLKTGLVLGFGLGALVAGGALWGLSTTSAGARARGVIQQASVAAGVAPDAEPMSVDPADSEVRLASSARVAYPVEQDPERPYATFKVYRAAGGYAGGSVERVENGFALLDQLTFLNTRGEPVKVLDVDVTASGDSGQGLCRYTSTDGCLTRVTLSEAAQELTRVDAVVRCGLEEARGEPVTLELPIPLEQQRTVEVGGVSVTVTRTELEPGYDGQMVVRVVYQVAREYELDVVPSVSDAHADSSTRSAHDGQTEIEQRFSTEQFGRQEPVELSLPLQLERPQTVEVPGLGQVELRSVSWDQDTLVIEVGPAATAHDLDVICEPRSWRQSTFTDAAGRVTKRFTYTSSVAERLRQAGTIPLQLRSTAVPDQERHFTLQLRHRPTWTCAFKNIPLAR